MSKLKQSLSQASHARTEADFSEAVPKGEIGARPGMAVAEKLPMPASLSLTRAFCP